MDKNKILGWVEYAGKIITWVGGAVRSFPVMANTENKKTDQNKPVDSVGKNPEPFEG